MTDGEEERTIPWIDRLEARHAWMHDAGGYALRNGIRSYPRCMLVAPDGVVVWFGEPRNLDDAVVEKHLTGAIDVPLWKWPKEVSAVSSALAQRRWGVALVTAGRLGRADESLAPWRDRAVALVETLLAGVERAFEGSDVLGAWEAAYWFRSELRGTSLESRVEEIVKRIQDDAGTMAMYETQTRLRELTSRVAADVPAAREIIAALEKVAKENPGTVAARDATNGVRYWKSMIGAGHLPAKAAEKPAGEEADGS